MAEERIFIEAEPFIKNWKNKLKLNDEDLRNLQSYLLNNPGIGDKIEGAGGLVKLRWRLPNTGKSGGIRILYIDFADIRITMLVNCYGKGEKDNITDKEKVVYKQFVKEIRKELEQ